jgi:hypothetical protein
MITTSVMRKKKRVVHYVNNSDFYDALIIYKDQVREAATEDRPKPRIPNYIGECFLKIATHLSFKPNFVNYTSKDSMISDGYTDCVKYVLNFNPDVTKNPFAYFTQICYWAFVRRIKQEKRNLELYDRLLERNGYEQVFTEDNGNSDNSNYSDFNTIKDNIHQRMRY